MDKQYRLYTWNDAKTQALITTNSLLFAAIGFLFKECLKDTLAILLIGLAVLFLALSLIISLKQVIPRITSGKSGDGSNTRSLRGISLFKTWADYYGAFMLTTKSTILTDTVRQIYGMADNNLRSARIIKSGVYLTTAGVILILCAIYVSAFAARGHHALGLWQNEVADVVAVPSTVSSNAVPQAPVPGVSTNTSKNPLAVAATQTSSISAILFTNLNNKTNGRANP